MPGNTMTLSSLLQESRQDPNLLTIEATVASGFEYIAVEECIEKLCESASPVSSRGRIFFNVPAVNIDKVQKLRSVDHLFVVINRVPNLQFTGYNLDEDIAVIQKIVKYEDVAKAVGSWCKINNFKGIIYPTREVYDSAKTSEDEIKALARTLTESRLRDAQSELSANSDERTCEGRSSTPSKEDQNKLTQDRTKFNAEESKAYNELDKRKPEDKVLKYRVTCFRNGNHIFGSQDAARGMGGTLQDMFNWVVDLNLYDMEIVLHIHQDTLYYGIALTKESKHHRNITIFGPTTLRATICYNMLRLAQPKAGDIIIDPMCGGGSISIEGALAYPGCFYLCGDQQKKAVNRTEGNLRNASFGNKVKNVDAFSWDATHLPLRDSSVDVFITDLPFGKRCGSVYDNNILYKKTLVELARVVSKKNGRAVLLTYDKRSMCSAIKYTAGLWSMTKRLTINIGGLQARVYVLTRLNTEATMPPPPSRPKGRQAKKKLIKTDEEVCITR